MVLTVTRHANLACSTTDTLLDDAQSFEGRPVASPEAGCSGDLGPRVTGGGGEKEGWEGIASVCSFRTRPQGQMVVVLRPGTAL